MKQLPHKGVYTRLFRSPIHGVGVLAIRRIPKRMSIFFGDDDPLIWIKKSSLKRHPREIRRLYDDFCISKVSRLLTASTVGPRNRSMLAFDEKTPC